MIAIARRRLRRRILIGSTSARARRNASIEDFLTSLTHVHRLVLAGHALEAAIAGAALTHPSHDITRLHTLVSGGESVSSACRNLLNSHESHTRGTAGDRDAVIALRVLSLAGSIGGRVAEHIESVVEMLSDRAQLRYERTAQAATSAASMRMLGWLPALCAAWILFDSSSVRTFMFSTVGGWTCLILGAALNLIGRIWLRRVVMS